MKILLSLLTSAAMALCVAHADAQTLKTVKDRGQLLCGVSRGLAGFSSSNASGAWSGFDVDFCRAVAAAVLNDPAKVTFVPLSADERFIALQNGSVDLLSRNSTWTMEREAKLHLLFGAITYYDGQGFLIPTGRNITSALDLDGSKVCVQSGTTNVRNTQDFFNSNTMKLDLVSVPTSDDLVKAYEDGRCDTISTDVSQLYALRVALKTPGNHIVLPDVISREPLGPVVRQGDDQWFNVVKWTHFGMVNAEELGVNSGNLEQALTSQKPDVRRLVGTEPNDAEQLGLTPDFVVRIVRAVGNYGEVFERNVGIDSKLAIPRGLNQLWNMGGIQYAPPLQ